MSLTKLVLLDPHLIARCGGKSEFKFRSGINILTGPNGSGKSTVLGAIRDATIGKGASYTAATVEVADPRYPYPVLHHATSETTRSGDTSAGSNLLSLQTSVKSHGQSLGEYLTALESLTLKSVVLIDEPETALDFGNLTKFQQLLVQKVAIGVQFIIASHSPLIWATAFSPEVVSVSRCTSLTNLSYIRDCLNGTVDMLTKFQNARAAQISKVKKLKGDT